MSNEELQTIHRTLGEIISKNLHQELFYLISFIYFSIVFHFELAGILVTFFFDLCSRCTYNHQPWNTFHALNKSVLIGKCLSAI